MGLFGFGKKKKEETSGASAPTTMSAQGGGTVTPAFTDASTAKELNDMVFEEQDARDAEAIDRAYEALDPELLAEVEEMLKDLPPLDLSNVDASENGEFTVQIQEMEETNSINEEPQIEDAEFNAEVARREAEISKLEAELAELGEDEEDSPEELAREKAAESALAEYRALLDDLQANPEKMNKYTQEELVAMFKQIEAKFNEAQGGDS